jgi:large subunit ribosomal protein L25
MEPVTLAIESRTGKGKGDARKLRARGLVPGVFYGPGTAPVGVAATPKALTQALTTAHRRNALLRFDIGGKSHLAMLKELQVHPVTRAVRHFDLYEVALDRPVATRVPLVTEGRAKGVIAGGEVTVVFRELPVRSAPDKVPALIQVDVTNMELGDVLKVKDLKLPEGVEVTMPQERNVITCAEPRKQKAEDEATAEGAAAPAAGGAAPAAPAAS